MKKSTVMPMSLVAPIPLIVEAPTASSARAVRTVRSCRVFESGTGRPPSVDPMNAREMCAENSTAIPTEMTRLTRLSGLSETSQTPMTPTTERSVKKTVMVTRPAVRIDPRKMEPIIQTAVRASVKTALAVDRIVESTMRRAAVSSAY